MDWPTFFIIIVLIIPIYVMIFMVMFWFHDKFDRYESIAEDVLTKYTQTMKPQIPRNNTDDEVQLRKLQKKYLIEGSIHAISATLKDRYRNDALTRAIDSLSGRVGYNADDWLDDNPIISAGLDLLTCAWTHGIGKR